MIANNLAEEDYRLVEMEDFWADVHRLLDRAILTVTEGAIQDIILFMLHKNCTFPEACRRMGIPEQIEELYSKYRSALGPIRRHLRGRAKSEFKRLEIDDYLYVRYKGVGLMAWQNVLKVLRKGESAQ